MFVRPRLATSGKISGRYSGTVHLIQQARMTLGKLQKKLREWRRNGTITSCSKSQFALAINDLRPLQSVTRHCFDFGLQ
jgi:hypothetical protein